MELEPEEWNEVPEAGVDEAWFEEIRRRSAEFDAGLVKAIPAEAVLAEARARLIA